LRRTSLGQLHDGAAPVVDSLLSCSLLICQR
jgi:hypothetical protein